MRLAIRNGELAAVPRNRSDHNRN